ncbi:UNVERIFIED_CONTAM: hypothetical protein GTU68_030936 [Idotea baltica]|nr:hypothetical protein [Idotea baltica]
MSQFFSISSPVQFAGPDSLDPLSYKYFHPDRVIEDRTMIEHIRPAVAFWHTLVGTGSDPFGPGAQRPSWPTVANNREEASLRLDAGFELLNLLGIPFFCFHDTDLIKTTSSFSEYEDEMDWLTEELQSRMKLSAKKCLWATQNCFSHPRYMEGASTACSFDVFTYAAAQTERALRCGFELGAENHVFWDGRGGYSILQNRDIGADLDHKAALLKMAVSYAAELQWDVQFLIEPKPKEPTTLQFDSDVPSCYAFLQHYGLEKDFQFNIEDNHATLAGHSFAFELAYARERGMLGSIDANQGHSQLGWDTDHMPYCGRNAALAWIEILAAGGFDQGGTNFDAKVRRESVEPDDRICGHVLALDTYALGLMTAAQLRKEGLLQEFIEERYRSWSSELANSVSLGEASFEQMRQHVLALGGETPLLASGKEEVVEQMITGAMVRAVRLI